MFLCDLYVKSVAGQNLWQLTKPLLWKYGAFMHCVPAKFYTDFASIPAGFRWLISNHDHRVLRPAVLHDHLIDSQKVTRKRADEFFRYALAEEGVGRIKRNVMFFAVRGYAAFAAIKKRIRKEFK